MRTTSIVSSVLAVSFASAASANLLVNGGFEINSITTDANVLTNFSTYQGIWGPEAGVFTVANGGVVPLGPTHMLKMDNVGGVYTQAYQSTYIGAFSGAINAGLAHAVLQADFNTGPFLSGAIAGVRMHFFSAGNWISQIGTGLGTSGALDGMSGTWESITRGATIPVGTTWIVSEVWYKNSTLFSSNGSVYSGYVDNAYLGISNIPSPGAAGLLAIVSVVGARRRRIG